MNFAGVSGSLLQAGRNGRAAACSTLLDQSEKEAGNGENRKYHEQDLGDARSTCGQTAKAENGCNQGNDKEHNGVVQHDEAPQKVVQ